MFKPQSLKNSISLESMKDDQVQRMKKSHPPRSNGVTQQRSSNANIKRLTWDEMQRRRTQGLCFNCNKRFTPGHSYSEPQLLLLEIEVKPRIVGPGEKMASYMEGNLHERVFLNT